jgi:hypothetical protein
VLALGCGLGVSAASDLSHGPLQAPECTVPAGTAWSSGPTGVQAACRQRQSGGGSYQGEGVATTGSSSGKLQCNKDPGSMIHDPFVSACDKHHY